MIFGHANPISEFYGEKANLLYKKAFFQMILLRLKVQEYASEKQFWDLKGS